MKKDNTSEIFKILSHPLRSKILNYIMKNSPVSFTDLNNEFKLEVGTLYYHLKLLQPLLQQDEDHKYYLSEQGKEAYIFSRQNTKTDEVTTEKPKSKFENQFKYLFLTPLIDYLLKDPKRTLIESILLTFILGLQTHMFGLQSEILFFTPNLINPLPVIMLQVFVRWLFVLAVVQVITRFVFKRKEDSFDLIVIVPFTILPLSIYPLIWFLVFNVLGSYFVMLDIVLQLVLQIWSLSILALTIGKVKGLKIEKAGFISIVIQYSNFILIWVWTLFLV
ncbi:MAG: winged helix-turn-helix domain-containing protein [Candidatus Ranarchaeia archaeon]